MPLSFTAVKLSGIGLSRLLFLFSRTFFIRAGGFVLAGPDHKRFTVRALVAGRPVPEGEFAIRIAAAGKKSFALARAFFYNIACLTGRQAFLTLRAFNAGELDLFFNIFAFGIFGTAQKFPKSAVAALKRRAAEFAFFINRRLFLHHALAV